MVEMKTQYITFTKPVIDGNSMRPKTFHVIETNDPVLGNIEVESEAAADRLYWLLNDALDSEKMDDYIAKEAAIREETRNDVHQARTKTHCNDCGNKLIPTVEFEITGALVSEKEVDPTCWSCT